MTNDIDTDDDEHARHLGTIGETEIYIVARGPKANWCADVLTSKCQRVFDSVKQQVEDL